MSQHIGDLENKQAYDYYTATASDFIKFYGIKPRAIACDMHPDYLSTRFAEEYAEKAEIPLVYVQHHYAHMLSVMAEHGHYKKSIGIIMDGTGYGEDGNTWGGEFLTGDFNGYIRAGHLKYIKLPGGDLASKQAWRTAISILSGFLKEKEIQAFYRGYKAAALLKALKSGINVPLSSGAGRLFDAAASILGLCHVSTYDAEAPMKLEAAATDVRPSEVYDFKLGNSGNSYILDMEPAFKQLWKNRKDKKTASNFHFTFASALAETAGIISNDTGIKDIVLSGGVFQNTVLLQMLLKILQNRGFNVLIHEKLPPNDSSIALGQAVYAAKQFHF
jgi:hydrogenase maturation protein HypF